MLPRISRMCEGVDVRLPRSVAGSQAGVPSCAGPCVIKQLGHAARAPETETAERHGCEPTPTRRLVRVRGHGLPPTKLGRGQ